VVVTVQLLHVIMALLHTFNVVVKCHQLELLDIFDIITTVILSFVMFIQRPLCVLVVITTMYICSRLHYRV